MHFFVFDKNSKKQKNLTLHFLKKLFFAIFVINKGFAADGEKKCEKSEHFLLTFN